MAHGGVDQMQMDQDDSMNTTITQSTIAPDYHNGYNNGNVHDGRPHTSYSDTGFSRPFSHSVSQNSDADTPPRYGYNNMPQQGSKPSSRPPSAMSGASQQDRGYDQRYAEANYREEQQSKQPKVIIKVGMVGDAQIGKTSLMVKYVEGSWDEDYIQTLGMATAILETIAMDY